MERKKWSGRGGWWAFQCMWSLSWSVPNVWSKSVHSKAVGKKEDETRIWYRSTPTSFTSNPQRRRNWRSQLLWMDDHCSFFRNPVGDSDGRHCVPYALRQRFQQKEKKNSISSSSSSSSLLEGGDEPQQKLDPTTATTIRLIVLTLTLIYQQQQQR